MDKFIDLRDITKKHELSIIVEAKINNEEICDLLQIGVNETYSFGIHLPYEAALKENTNVYSIMIHNISNIAKELEIDTFNMTIMSYQYLIKN